MSFSLHPTDDAALEPFLRFLIKYITHPACTAILIDVAHATLDLYTPVLGQSMLIDSLFSRLLNRLNEESTLQSECLQLQGEVEMLLSSCVDVDLGDYDSNMFSEHGASEAAFTNSLTSANVGGDMR